MDTYSLTVLQDRGLKSRCGQDTVFPRLWRRTLPCERAIGRKARGSPSRRNRLQVSDNFFFLSLKWQEEKNYKGQIFFPSLQKIKRRFLLKLCVTLTTPGTT